jgi:hypothetical protein
MEQRRIPGTPVFGAICFWRLRILVFREPRRNGTPHLAIRHSTHDGVLDEWR